MKSKLPCFYAMHSFNYKNGFATTCAVNVDQSHYLDGSLPSEFINSDGFRDLRLKLYNGEFPVGCGQCREAKRWGLKAVRDDLPEFYSEEFFNPETGEVDFKSIQMLEFRFNNSCNMSCLHCDHVFSSGWETKLKSYKPDQETIDLDIHQLLKRRHRTIGKLETLPRIDMRNDEVDTICDDLIKNFPNLRHFDVSGGEPLKQKQFFHVLKKMQEHPNIENMTVMFYSNFNADADMEELARLLDPYKFVTIHMSIDCGERIYHYFRDGDWNKLVENIKIFRKAVSKLPYRERKYHSDGINMELSGIITTSIYQLMDIENIFESMLTLDLDKIEAAMVTSPIELDPAILCNNHVDAVNDDIRATRKIINNANNGEHNSPEEFIKRANLLKTAMEALDLIDNHMQNSMVDFHKEIKFLKLNKETDKLMEQKFNDVFVKYQIVKVPGQRTKELVRV